MPDPVDVIQHASDTVNVVSVLLDSLTGFIPKLIAFCSIAAAITPRPDPASKWYVFLKPIDTIINYIAFNINHARNQNHD